MRSIVLGFLIMVSISLVSCDSKGKKLPFGLGGSDSTTGEQAADQTGGTSGNVPADQVNDQKDTKEFKFQTIHDVSFDLQLYDETNAPLGKAVVRVNTADGDITNSISAENGTVAFKASLNNALETISLIIEHPTCVTKTVEIADIQKLSQVSRSIFLELRAVAKAKPDRDKDGVPDDTDEFPDDPSLIGSTSAEYTIAYEDLWPAKGDADMNDLVVRLGIKEYIDNNNMISKIVVTARLLAAGAGYKNQLWISVLGKDYQLIFNPKQDLNGKYNSRPKEEYVQGPEHKVEIVLSPPVARDQMDAMPYDPYIKCNGNDKNQVHLSFVKSKFKGQVLDTDGFPWAIIVPAEWAWPYEGSSIFKAYPEFQKWYESKGADYKEWYLHPELANVYKVSVGTALAAYLMKVTTQVPAVAIAGVLLTMVLAILGINIWRRRSQKMGS